MWWCTSMRCGACISLRASGGERRGAGQERAAAKGPGAGATLHRLLLSRVVILRVRSVEQRRDLGRIDILDPGGLPAWRRSLSTTMARTPSAKSGCRIVVRVRRSSAAWHCGSVMSAPRRIAASVQHSAEGDTARSAASVFVAQSSPKASSRCKISGTLSAPKQWSIAAHCARQRERRQRCGMRASAAEPVLGQRARQRRQILAPREMRGEPGMHRIGALHARSPVSPR